MDLPPPRIRPKHILVALNFSCISPGTELASLESSGRSLLDRAVREPSKAIGALKRMRKFGIGRVLRSTKTKLECASLVGYSASGVVNVVGDGVDDFSEGMRVAVAGAGYANHAEQVVVPVNLAMRLPDGVSLVDASTCALGGIALQGVRRASVSIGDFVVVYGCGVIGLLTTQILVAAGCRPIGVDIDSSRLRLAALYGAERTLNPQNDDVVQKVFHITHGVGADRVILALGSSSSEPVHEAFRMSRRKGRVVLVGSVGMELDRKAMYKKELDFCISTSYGPGRYDPTYEEKGLDYPIEYVRWTENRNMQAYLEMLRKGKLRIEEMVSSKYDINSAQDAYESFKKTPRPLIVLLDYGEPEKNSNGKERVLSEVAETSWNQLVHDRVRVGVVGLGSFSFGVHLPNLKSLDKLCDINAVCDREGTKGLKAQKFLHMPELKLFTRYGEFLDSDIDAVIIATRHNSHATLAIEALRKGKAVFLEKPLCITAEEFKDIKETVDQSKAPFMVGYNRRFSPVMQLLRDRLSSRVNPMVVNYTVNGGYVPYNTWIQLKEEGGGRIIGEACHIFDLFSYLTDGRAEILNVQGILPNTTSVRASDNAIITIRYSEGSVCSLAYTGLGSRKAPKEKMEIYCDENAYFMTDYTTLESYGNPVKWKSRITRKGHLEEMEHFLNSISSGVRFPIPIDEIYESWIISYRAASMLAK